MLGGMHLHALDQAADQAKRLGAELGIGERDVQFRNPFRIELSQVRVQPRRRDELHLELGLGRFEIVKAVLQNCSPQAVGDRVERARRACAIRRRVRIAPTLAPTRRRAAAG